MPETAKTIRLKDYRPTPWLIPEVRLVFRLHPTATRVLARLTLRPNRRAKTPGGPLVLHGEKLKLVSISVNGKTLADGQYTTDPQGLTIPAPPKGKFVLDIETEINPAANTELTGLYLSNGIFCTQCEAEGFRRITYFYDRPDVLATYLVRIEAPENLPVLLSNGNPAGAGRLDKGWHFAEWADPHPKPSYLFALVAGALAQVSDTITTSEQRKVALNIYVERGKQDRCAWAMACLKAAMRWDEKAFGRAYDLDVFNIVAVPDFNMGAMENKGLNVFNDKYILARSDTATDADFELIESIVAHEYFHNWTGNRITCRDWFQLCLKEGLTVFRDQEFTADLRSRAVKRIDDVIDLRARQFPEDAGPLQHPPRPSEYIEINNFYTATVYDKGAEICRMLKTLLGEKDFQRGMQLYFKRHDGAAATVEEFVTCFADASGRNLRQFLRWYTQAGRPVVRVQEKYNSKTKSYELRLKQNVKRLKGQPGKQPLHLPLAVALLGRDGTMLGPGPQLLEMTRAAQSFRLTGIAEKPVLSFNRGFSAPIDVQRPFRPGEILHLLAHDSDGFNRWEAGQKMSEHLILAHYRSPDAKGWAAMAEAYAAALRQALSLDALEPAYRAVLLATPAYESLASVLGKEVDAARLHQSARRFRKVIGDGLGSLTESLFAQMANTGPYLPDAAANGRRSLRAALLQLSLQSGAAWAPAACRTMFTAAQCFSEEHAAMALAAAQNDALGEELLAAYHERHKDDALMLDKWFAAQARIEAPETAARVRLLMEHPGFSLKTPNRVYALIRSFIGANFTGFNAADGSGYALAADAILAADQVNPQVASRMATGFRSWRLFDVERRLHAQRAMQRILGVAGLSKDVTEIISRTLAA